jgi:signal transduction histidine kinase
MMVDPDGPRNEATVAAASELAEVREQTVHARTVLTQLRKDVAEAEICLKGSKGAQLVEANQTLVITALQAQSEAEDRAHEMERQRTEQALRLRSTRLEAENRQIRNTNRLKSEFISNMSHELRTPLNAIIGFAELLNDGLVPPDSQRQHEFSGHILSSGMHLLHLINEVLDLSQIEAGKMGFFPELVDLSQLCHGVLDVLRVSAQGQSLDMKMEIDPTLDDVVVDPVRLRQVFYNYLSNAIKFTPAGGKVTLRVFPETAECFRIEVEDSGMGIAADDIPRLFVEFQQLDSGHTKRHQGTGLGLAVTRRLVEAQGGSVGARSTLGKGSVFYAVLPRNNSQHEIAGPLSPASRPPA